MRLLFSCGSCEICRDTLRCRLRRAPIASRTKLNAGAVRGSGKLTRGVDESETGSANFFARNLAALARGCDFGQREGGVSRQRWCAEPRKARLCGAYCDASEGFTVGVDVSRLRLREWQCGGAGERRLLRRPRGNECVLGLGSRPTGTSA